MNEKDIRANGKMKLKTNRRAFLRTGVVAAGVALLLTACATTKSGVVSPSPSMTPLQAMRP